MPLVGLAVLPLQLAAWLLRGIVFEYLALAALGAYLSHYRWYHSLRHRSGHPTSARMTDTRSVPLARRRADEGVGDPPDGRRARQRAATSSRSRPAIPAPDTFPWDEFAQIAAELLGSRDGNVLQYGPTRGYRPLLDAIAGDHAAAAASRRRSRICW